MYSLPKYHLSHKQDEEEVFLLYLWPLAALFNPFCVGNAYRSLIGELGIRVSVQNLPGPQVYVQRDYDKTKAVQKEKMGIPREDFSTPSLFTIKSDLQELAQTHTHPACMVARLSLSNFHLARAQLYTSQGQPMNFIQSMVGAMQDLGCDH
ncbi:hypothetical protein F1880_009291 [Penicillium rolfsii]|nr:hypothetical protein F1880_009291 [Penicillium rolfsii]